MRTLFILCIAVVSTALLSGCGEAPQSYSQDLSKEVAKPKDDSPSFKFTPNDHHPGQGAPSHGGVPSVPPGGKTDTPPAGGGTTGK